MAYYVRRNGPDGAIINGQFYEAISEGKTNDARIFVQSQDWTYGKSYGQRLNLFKFAIDHNNIEIAKFIIAKDSMLDVKNSDPSNSLLHLAVLYRYVQFVEYLLVMNVVGIDARNDSGRTPLHLACYGGSTNIIKLLLEFGTDVNAVDVNGNTPLHLAAENYRQRQHHEDLLQLLLLAGASVNARNSKGLTPIHLAVINKREVTVRDLLTHGADVEAKTKDGKTPLSLALEIQALDIFVDLATCNPERRFNESTKEILKYVSAATKCKLLHAAISKRSVEIAKDILDSGVDVNASNVFGQTALHLATARNDEEIVQLILRRGAKVDAKDENGNTALHIAVKKGKKPLVARLLDYRANVDVGNKYGKTALHLAISEKNLGIVNLLLAKNASTTVKDHNGDTPLHLATKTCEDVDMLAVILEHGADVNTENKFKQTCLHLGVLRGNEEIVDFLIQNGANCTAKDQYGNTALHLAAKTCLKKSIVEMFLERGIDVNTRNNFDETILHVACGGKCEMRFQLLPSSGDVEDQKWWTLPYMSDLVDKMSRTNCKMEYQERYESLNSKPDNSTATSREVDVEALELLLEKGAEVEAQDANGHTPLYHAAVHCDEAVVKFLLDHEADIQTCDKTGKNVVCAAMERGHLEVCRLVANSDAILYYPCNDAAFLYGALKNTDNYRQIVESFALAGWVANLRAVNPYNLLLIVTKYKHIRIVEDCIIVLIDINKGNELGYTALHAATFAGHDGIMQLIAYQDSNVRQDNDGTTALHIAAYLGYIYGTELLLSFFALPNCRTHSGVAPLHLAALKRSNSKIISMLIQGTAYVNVKDEKGMTPLHYAAASGDAENVQALLSYGADINAINKENDTPLSFVNRCHKSLIPPCTFVHFGDEIIQDSKQSSKLTYSKVHTLLNNHASKLLYANLELCEINLSCLDNLGTKRRDCEVEVAKMKKEMISLDFSWHDLLAERSCKLAQQSESVKNCFSFDCLETKFPIFADLLKSRINLGMFLNRLMTDDDEDKAAQVADPIEDTSEHVPSDTYDLSSIYESEKMPRYNIEEDTLIEHLEKLI